MKLKVLMSIVERWIVGRIYTQLSSFILCQQFQDLFNARSFNDITKKEPFKKRVLSVLLHSLL